MGYSVHIDQELCVSSGKCVGDAPGAFAFNDDELAQAGPEAASLPAERLFAIARNCPGQAITVVDEDGTVLAP